MLHSYPQFELDEDRFELRRDGQTVKVEPRVLEVLAYLVRNRSRIVTKEELLDQVWKKSFVSESALTRCIMEARRAIGDPARDVPLIKTVHGRGYRFDVPDLEEEEEEEEDKWSGGLQAAEIEAIGGLKATGPLAAEVDVAGGLKATAPRIAAVFLLIAVLAGGWLWTRREVHASPRQAVVARVALLPISLGNEDRELQMVAMSIADLLEQRLSKIPQLRVRGPDYSRAISVSSPNLAELGRRAGAEYIISGSLSSVSKSGRARLMAVMHQIRADGSVRETPLGSFSIPLLGQSNDIGQYAVLRDRVVSRVVATVLPAFELGPEGALTPRDSESYRLYLLARERLAGGGCDGEAAIELLRRSIEIDDRFAPAWDAYAWALYRLSSACTAGSRHHQLALEAADRALVLAPAMGSALTLKAHVMAETGRVEEAYRLVSDALHRNPSDVDVLRAHSEILAQTGFLDQARAHLNRVMTLDANHLAVHSAIATPHLYAGDWQRFVDSLPDSESPRIRYVRGFAELMQGRPGVAYRTLEPAFRTNPADAHARLSHALLAVIEGRHDEARAITRHFVRQRELVGETDAEMTYRIAQLAALAGDDALALRQLERAIQQGFYCVAMIERDPALVSLRQAAGFSELLARASRRQQAFAARFKLEPARSSQIAAVRSVLP